jgi:thioredoxin reductase (NADPH)
VGFALACFWAIHLNVHFFLSYRKMKQQKMRASLLKQARLDFPAHRVVIVGSGPAGLTAAIYCGRAGLEPLVAGGSVKGAAPGGQLMTTTEVENYPGFPEGVTGPDLIEKMTQQAKKFGATVAELVVTHIDTSSRPFKVTFDDETVRLANSVIVATGASARWLGLKGESDFANRGISACATCDGPLKVFRNKVFDLSCSCRCFSFFFLL